MARLALALVLLTSAAHAATVTGRVTQDSFRVAEYGLTAAGKTLYIQDGDGRFTLRDVPPGKYRLVLMGWTFARRTIDFEVTTKDVALGTIVVEQGRALTGRVVDAAGTLVDGATVMVYETRPNKLYASPIELMLEGVLLATSRHDGTFTIFGLPEEPENLRLLAFGDDMISSEHALTSDTWDAELAIGRPGTITGKVTNRRRMPSPIIRAMPAGFAGKPSLAGVDPQGNFRFELPAGVYDLALPDETAAPLQVVVVEGRTRRVTLTAPTTHVELAVETPECVYVRLLGARPQSKAARTEIGFELCEDNRARFTRLPPGNYRVCVDTTEESACEPIKLGAAARVLRLQGAAHE